ncbi:protein XRI1 [Daucus carota subsp. sativus]|uniref:protein XRI1 n=1 Tax=Daucus carota subsp. sativus TaxID=79200 RepID=UPI0007DF5754|nr:PREDICTED: protein XRI1-like [Daucus carota subsp. sativus]
MGEWQDDEFFLQDDINIPIWDELGQSEESLYFGFNDITPAKVCGDSAYHNANSGDISSSKRIFADNTEGRKEDMMNCSQAKRRRTLQFECEALPIPYCNEEMSPTSLEEILRGPHCSEEMPPTFLGEKDREDTQKEFSNIAQWVPGGDASSYGYKDLIQSSEGQLANCFHNNEIQFNSDNVVRSGASKAHNAGSSGTLPVQEASAVQKNHPQSRQNVVFKGKKSYMQTPTKATSSVVYPFAFIKPCGVNGVMTLKDINQRICTPPMSKQKEDLSSIYPTSAFSGKPVVGQMKIHTEGGKGCITILRTKG